MRENCRGSEKEERGSLEGKSSERRKVNTKREDEKEASKIGQDRTGQGSLNCGQSGTEE